MVKDPNEVKVLALKPEVLPTRRRVPVSKENSLSDDTKPGNNTPGEVRSAQRNLLACGIAADMVGVISHDDGLGVVHKLDNEKYDPLMDEILEMITPNTAYVTGPPTMGSIKETFHDGGLSVLNRKDKEYKAWREKKGYDT